MGNIIKNRTTGKLELCKKRMVFGWSFYVAFYEIMLYNVKS